MFITPDSICPCGHPKSYDQCCGLFHQHPGRAPTAEALMRSRYSAFALHKFDYICATQRLANGQHPSESIIADAQHATHWLKLDILACEKGLETDSMGMVEFCAYFQEGKHPGQLKERSLFEKIDGQWFYTAGEHEVKATTVRRSTTETLGRNDPCHCGSGRKFKKCCGMA